MKVLDWHTNTQYSEDEARLHLGRIPILIDPDSDDPVWLKFTANYERGWNPEPPGKWSLMEDHYLLYPGLPPIAPAAMAYHRSEQVLVYPAGWVAIVQLDGAFTIGRIEP